MYSEIFVVNKCSCIAKSEKRDLFQLVYFIKLNAR